jgi:hypothetical protein
MQSAALPTTYASGLAAAGLIAAMAAGLILAGCGTPAAPQPPSLKLPVPVADLAASRTGNQVTLTWTMPKKSTDKLLLKGSVATYVCRKETVGGNCIAAGAAPSMSSELSFAPGAVGSLTETLPATLAAGAPRPLSYFVELKNGNGRSAGLSNAAVVLAGEAPAPVANLSAEVRKAGVVLRWEPLRDAAQESSAIRLHRKLLNPPPAKPQQGQQGLLAPQPEPVEQNLLIDSCAPEAGKGGCRALDSNIHFGPVYEYRAQRVARVTVEGKTLELAGELSVPVRVEARDIFPPAVPTGLAAVATTGDNGAGNAIDLSWQPVTDADLAGYAVYRREGDGGWQRISPAGPLVPPAFHDSQVQPGHSYRYAVSSISQGGNESARSAETEESMPNP